MFELIELLKKFENDFSQHIHSLYLIGSRAEGNHSAKSDYDIVCLTQSAAPYSVTKMMIYEFHKMGVALNSQVESYIIPVDYFLQPQHFASYDFLVRVSMKDHGKCLLGESVIPGMIPITEKDLFNFRFWMCIVMYNALAKDEKPTHHFMTSLLVSLSVLSGLIPSSEWVSKRRLLQSIGGVWTEGETWLRESEQLPAITVKENLLKLAEHLVEKNLQKWKDLPSLSFTKPFFEFEKIAFDDKFLLQKNEATAWNDLKNHQVMVIDKPLSRLEVWWNHLKRH